jgi:hypothetical protein
MLINYINHVDLETQDEVYPLESGAHIKIKSTNSVRTSNKKDKFVNAVCCEN